MWAVMTDYGIPAGDNRGDSFTSLRWKNDWDANASCTRLRNQCDVVLVGKISGKERNARSASSWDRSHHTTDGNGQLRIESSSLASVRYAESLTMPSGPS
jgi:hypothetical protein